MSLYFRADFLGKVGKVKEEGRRDKKAARGVEPAVGGWMPTGNFACVVLCPHHTLPIVFTQHTSLTSYI